jgi:hypothetical protein
VEKVGYQAHPLRHLPLKLLNNLPILLPYPPKYPPKEKRLDGIAERHGGIAERHGGI